MKTRISLAAALLLAIGMAPALAQLPSPDAPKLEHPRAEWCAQNPEKCTEMKKKYEARKAQLEAECAANPQKCEEIKKKKQERMAERQERKAQCKADPEKCKAERKAKVEARRAELEAKCKAQPDGPACKRLESWAKKDAPAP